MRTARLTWKGAFHHVMNRGLNKQKVFVSDNLKEKYIKLMAEKSKKFEITIFAYCIMDNHFHIALENSSGNLSEFMRSLNGQFGHYYRKITSSKGYVFEDRFKSTIVQDESYLTTLIIYILQNPVRSGYLKNPIEYKWSSVNEYYRSGKYSFINKQLVEDSFISRDLFYSSLISIVNLEVNEFSSKVSRVLGGRYFRRKIENINNIKSGGLEREDKIRRIINNIICNFETKNSIKISELLADNKKEKILRNRLLVELKSDLLLKYKDIMGIELFKNIKYNTIRKLYSLGKRNLL